jgi:hypothetical protein
MLKAKNETQVIIIISVLYVGSVVSVLEHPRFPRLNLFAAIFAPAAEAELRPDQCRVGFGARPGR